MELKYFRVYLQKPKFLSMKKFALVIFTVLLMADLAAARKFRFGFEAGLDISKPSNCDGTACLAYNYGLLGEYDFKSSMKGAYIILKLDVAAKHWNHTVMKGSYKGKLIAHPVYLQMPIMVGWRVPVSDKISLKFEAGPYFAQGYLGASKVNYYNGHSKPYTEDVKDCFGENGICKRFDTGISLGVGFSVGKYWQFGVNTAIQLNKFDQVNNRSNRTYGLSAGLLF